MSVPSTARVLLAATLAVAVGLTLYLFSAQWLLLFLSILLAIILSGLSGWLSHYLRLPRRLALVCVSLLLLVVVAALAYRVMPRLLIEAQELWHRLYQQATGWLNQPHPQGWQRWLLHKLSSPSAMPDGIATSATSFVSTAVHGAIALLISLVVAFYLALEPAVYVAALLRLFPVRHRARAREIMNISASTLLAWAAGRFVDMRAVGILTAVGLTLLGIPLALALAALAALLTFVPYFGAIAAAAPAMMIGLSISWQKSLWVLLIFVCCHLVEGYVVAPLIQRRWTRLPPAVTLLSMSVLGGLLGPWGVVLGAPLAAGLIVILREAYVIDVLERRRALPIIVANSNRVALP